MIEQKIRKIKSGKDKFFLLWKNFWNGYITFHIRPKRSSDTDVCSDSLNIYPKVAIIIQGPLLKKNNFTIETVKLYKKIFSNYLIILSTWEDEDQEYLSEIKKENILIF